MSDGSGGDFLEGRFELREGVFNGVEIRAVGREKAKMRSCCCDGIADGITLVGRQIVHDDDVTWLQDRRKELLDIGQEDLTVDGTIKHHGCDHAIDPDSADECCGLPVSMGDTDMQPLAFDAAPTRTRHRR